MVSVEWNGATSKYAVNGAVYTDANPGSVKNKLTTLTIGGYDTGQAITALNGGITTIVVLSAALSTAQRQALEGLLNGYFAIY